METPRVSIILLNYHGIEDTLECLSSIRNADVVVVDVEDKKDSQHIQAGQLLAVHPEIHLVTSENLGFSGGNNLGARYALEHLNPDYLMFLNNDTRLDKRTIELLVEQAQKSAGKPDVFVPKIYFEKGCEFHKDAYAPDERGKVLWYAGGHLDKKNVYAWHRGVDEVDFGQFDEPEITDFGTGCCFFLAADTFKKVGGWNEAYFLYLEDLEYSTRVQKMGGKVIFVPQAVVWHKNAGSTGGSGSLQHVYYQTRNRLHYGLHFANLRTKIALLRESVKIMENGTQNQKEAVLDALFGKMNKKKKFHT